VRVRGIVRADDASDIPCGAFQSCYVVVALGPHERTSTKCQATDGVVRFESDQPGKENYYEQVRNAPPHPFPSCRPHVWPSDSAGVTCSLASLVCVFCSRVARTPPDATWQLGELRAKMPDDPQQQYDIFVHVYIETEFGAKRVGYKRFATEPFLRVLEDEGAPDEPPQPTWCASSRRVAHPRPPSHSA
jgi:hypothetical protein